MDLETRLDLKSIGLALEGGYLHDNPTDAENSKGKPLSLGNAKGYYLQGDYAVPPFNKLHIVGCYSWLDPNTDVDDKYDVDYKSIGFYYLFNGWQAAIRSSYIWANKRKVKETPNNLFTTEFQLLF